MKKEQLSPLHVARLVLHDTAYNHRGAVHEASNKPAAKTT